MTVIASEQITLNGVSATRVTYDEGWKPTADYVDGCSYCDREKERGSWFFPDHFAMNSCQSGKRNHCTCDGCF